MTAVATETLSGDNMAFARTTDMARMARTSRPESTRLNV